MLPASRLSLEMFLKSSEIECSKMRSINRLCSHFITFGDCVPQCDSLQEWTAEHGILSKQASKTEPSWLSVQLHKRAIKFNSIETAHLQSTFPEIVLVSILEGMFLKHTHVWWPKMPAKLPWNNLWKRKWSVLERNTVLTMSVKWLWLLER